jgi:hypothetical protein
MSVSHESPNPSPEVRADGYLAVGDVIQRSFILLLILGLAVGCRREVTDANATHYPPHVGGAVWTLAGVRPGMTLETAKQLKGAPSKTFGNPPDEFSWDRSAAGGELTVKVDKDGTISEASGEAISVSNSVVLTTLASDEEVQAVLGTGTNQKIMGGSGAFVIALPAKQLGTQYEYHNGDVVFEVTVMKDRGLTGVVAKKSLTTK